MIDDVMLVFDGNIRRINRLVSLYGDLAAGPGRKSTYQLEILRASVVLLHSKRWRIIYEISSNGNCHRQEWPE